MKPFRAFLLSFCLLMSFSIRAQRGVHGPRTITALNTVVNEYTTLTASAFVGATTLTVGNSSLNANGRFAGNLGPGDMLMILHMQGIDMYNGATLSDTAYGKVNNYYFCGNYEFCQVLSVPNATTINIDCALTKDFFVNGGVIKAQVIRVPRYTALTVNAGASLTCDDWTGSIGGVVMVEVNGNVTVNGSIDATAKGFRGGSLVGDNASSSGGVSDNQNTGNIWGAEKGEGIAGYQSEYDLTYSGRYCRGAPANGGGGGNSHNAGGGGGANAPNSSATTHNWTGCGIPDLTGGGWTTAWNLDFATFSTLTTANSEGGGRGGYSFSNSNQNATVTPPGNLAWVGDNRSATRPGLGGHPLNYSTGKLFLGGGGGAGDQNNNYGGSGGDGGGMIYLWVTGTISGTGTIISNGANGLNAQGIPSATGFAGSDGAGGGGGGGTCVLNATGGVSGISVITTGGNGGNQVMSYGALYVGINAEAEGPGGGGGGGYIAVSSGAPTRVSNGGNNGTTNSLALTEFLPNGATKGCPGTTNASITNWNITASNITICAGNTATLTAAFSGSPPGGAVLQWYNVATGGTAIATGTSYTTGVLAAGTYTYYVGSCPGWFRVPVTVTAVSSPSSVTWSSSSSSSWALSANWLSCAVPACGVSAVIATSTIQPILTAGTYNVNDITINAGATLTMNAGATLVVCGNFTNNGSLVANPGATILFNNAAVVQNINGALTGTNKFPNLVVTKTGGSVVLNANIDIGGSFTTSNATSVFNTTGKYIRVAGNFSNADGNNTFTNVTGGTLEFNGAVAQTYNQGTSTLALNNVLLNHTSTGVTCATNLVVGTAGTLTLTLGKLITNANEVQVTNTASAACTAGNTSSFVQGNLRRYLSGAAVSYDLPVGHATKGYQRANITFTSTTTIPQLLAFFTPWATVPLGPTASECPTNTYNVLNALDNGYWTITASANPTSGNYDVSLYNTNHTNSGGASGWTVMKAATIIGPWGLNGTCVTTSTPPLTQRTGLNGFSVFATAQSVNPLPVELLSFTGRSMGSYNRLEWITASETNNNLFVIERSVDGGPFEDIGTVNGAGNSTVQLSYHFDDLHPAAGTNYYRLRQMDFNGDARPSNIVIIQSSSTATVIENIHPNPTNGAIYFDFIAPEKTILHIVITDMFGRIVWEENIETETGRNSLKTVIEEVSGGVYTLSISDEHSGVISVTRIVKM
jgi:Ig-like domain CHU_C associated/Secretion system C-terminal sorting domain